MQFLQPLAVEDIRLAARDVLDVAGIDQVDLETAGFQDFKEGNPVDTG